MNREFWKERLPIIEEFASGGIIQAKPGTTPWADVTNGEIDFSSTCPLRVKPSEPEYQDGIYVGNRTVLLVRKDGYWHHGHGPAMSKRDINGFKTIERIGDFTCKATALDKLQAMTNGFVPDWGNSDQGKWYIQRNHRVGRYVVVRVMDTEPLNIGPFRTEREALAATKKLEGGQADE
ncbi:hypothetical protein [Kiloniella laminariae]|uniref:hypothetical protein n=1 Tax=Kiloniella laminariae TaxID=454162 RepID=UPI0003754290|nr:hypothetical protein [Kiloniella laminariae]